MESEQRSIYFVVKELLDRELLRCYIFINIDEIDVINNASKCGVETQNYLFIPTKVGTIMSRPGFITTTWGNRIHLLSDICPFLQLSLQGIPINCIPTIEHNDSFNKLLILIQPERTTLFELKCKQDRTQKIKANLEEWLSQIRDQTGIFMVVIVVNEDS